MIRKYLFNQLLSLDQSVNAFFGGDPDETLSSRFGKRSKSNLVRKVIDVVIFWQPQHTAKSIEPDEGRDAVIK